MEKEDFVFSLALNTKGTVYLVRQESTGRLLVGRPIQPDQEIVYRYLQQVKNPHIPAVRDIQPQPDGQVFAFLDYIQGVSLDQYLRGQSQPLPQRQAVDIAIQLCDALEALHHAGIVHRDVKPENIILSTDGTAVLTDFDIARLEKPGLHRDTTLLGTQGYAAPEQFGFQQSDSRSDIYALGVVINQMVTGRFPNEYVAGGPLGNIIRTCTHMDPQQRYPDAGALRKALAALVPPGRPFDRPAPAAAAAPPPYVVDLSGAAKYAPQAAGKRRCLLRRIPGFRQGKLLHVLAALVGYPLLVLFALAGISVCYTSVQHMLIFVGIMLIPAGWYVFICNLFHVQDRLLPRRPLTRTQFWGWYFLVLLLWIIFAFGTMMLVLLLFQMGLGLFFPADAAGV